MLAVLIVLTPACQNEFIDGPKAYVHFTVQMTTHVKTWWILTQELHHQAYKSRELTHKWLKNPRKHDCWTVFTTEDESIIMK